MFANKFGVLSPGKKRLQIKFVPDQYTSWGIVIETLPPDCCPSSARPLLPWRSLPAGSQRCRQMVIFNKMWRSLVWSRCSLWHRLLNWTSQSYAIVDSDINRDMSVFASEGRLCLSGLNCPKFPVTWVSTSLVYCQIMSASLTESQTLLHILSRCLIYCSWLYILSFL